MRGSSQFSIYCSTLLFVAGCVAETTGSEPSDSGEVEALSAALSDADSDGDGVYDINDNCPNIANADQRNSNNAGPGDACELSLLFGSSAGSEYAQFQTHKQLLLLRAPFTLMPLPDLLRVTATAPLLATAQYSSSSKSLGVRGLLELGAGGDSIRSGEELTIGVGTDLVLGGGRAVALGIRLKGAGTSVVALYKGTTKLTEKTTVLTTAAQLVTLSSGASAFDRITVRASSGSVAIKAEQDALFITVEKASLPCPIGYELSGTKCVDTNECSGPRHSCDPLTICTNSVGSFTCGACPAGYTGSGYLGCVDVNECENHTADCSPLVTCGNTAGSFQCGACPAGYAGDGRTCSDVDECAQGTATCGASATCTNTVGAYTCNACAAGYRASGNVCTDIDECAEGSAHCDALTTCTNTAGSFACGACPAGFSGNGATGCVDVDECANDTDDCSPLVTCGNTVGGFQCGECPAGFSGDGHVCNDVNECQLGTATCAAGVACVNVPGGYQCGSCPQGYAGDGHVCTDIDECASHPCDALSTCRNTAGSYTCGACPAGYTGDGYAGCVDVDECATNNGDCDPLSVCTNTGGAFECGACPDGYLGDGDSGCEPAITPFAFDSTALWDHAFVWSSLCPTGAWGQTFTLTVPTTVEQLSFWGKTTEPQLDGDGNPIQTWDPVSFRVQIAAWQKVSGQAVGPTLFTSGVYATTPTLQEFVVPTGGLVLPPGLYVAAINSAQLGNSDDGRASFGVPPWYTVDEHNQITFVDAFEGDSMVDTQCTDAAEPSDYPWKTDPIDLAFRLVGTH